MVCLFALLVAFLPRVALFFVWVFTPLVTRAFNTFIVPLVGLVFLPFTTLIYVLVWNPVTHAVTGWGWFWVILALAVELGSYGGSAYGNRRSIPGYQAPTA